MGKSVSKWLCLILFFLCLPALNGCVLFLGAAAGGAGTAYWFANKISDEVNASYEHTIEATRGAFTSLRLVVEKESRTDEVTQFISTYTDGSKVWVDVRPMGETKTKIDVRVGVKGDEAASTQILNRIKSRL